MTFTPAESATHAQVPEKCHVGATGHLYKFLSKEFQNKMPYLYKHKSDLFSQP